MRTGISIYDDQIMLKQNKHLLYKESVSVDQLSDMKL